MKVAILLSGHSRSYDSARTNIYENLIKPIQDEGHEVYIYTSLWTHTGYREKS
jgi:hypothetical protein